MDKLAEALKAQTCPYADSDPASVAELRRRIEEAGKLENTITYSDLVNGIDFHFPSFNGGLAYRIDIHDWSGNDRMLIGNCLASISRESYLAHGFLANALVVTKGEMKPSPVVFDWLVSLGILPDAEEETVLPFWIEHMSKAHQWYAYGKK